MWRRMSLRAWYCMTEKLLTRRTLGLVT